VGLAHLRALIAALLLACAAYAHEIGTTQVTARFEHGQYAIDVLTSPTALLRKIDRRPGATLAMHTRELADAAEIRFGSVRVEPEVVFLPNDVIRFRGAIPRNAGPFTWRWHLTYASYSLTIGNQRQWLDGDAVSQPFRTEPVVTQYLRLGFTHIVPGGLDHILFVLGIFLLTTRIKPMLTQVTAFTIAHSITLGLTIYGLVSVSPRIVEPAIALSIAYVAIENIATTQLKPWRVAIVFAFGLLHGMGFAGVLKELGLPRSEFLPALVSFNVGVELGQLAVIGTAFLLVACWARTKPWYRQAFVVPASALIALTGIFWTVQRVLA
jgi:hydrogenase/urease accessory protein HupE